MRDNAAGSHINAAVAIAAQYAQLSNTTIVRNSFTSNQFQRALNGAAAISTMTMAQPLLPGRMEASCWEEMPMMVVMTTVQE
jgi:hypothetical protein